MSSAVLLDRPTPLMLEEESPTLSLAEKQDLVKNTITHIQSAILERTEALKGNAMPKEDERMIKTARRLNARLRAYLPQLQEIPGCCLYTKEEDYLNHVTSIAEKQERVGRVICWLNKHQDAAHTYSDKVHEYFHKTMGKLKQGINVPLPDFFHASRTGLPGIIECKEIERSTRGDVGPGTYISTENEGVNGFGPHTLAIDENILKNTSARYLSPLNPKRLWIAVQADIPISEETIAYIDTAHNDATLIEQKLKESNLNIPVIDRITSLEIRRIMSFSDGEVPPRELPSFNWSGVAPPNGLSSIQKCSRTVQGQFGRPGF